MADGWVQWSAAFYQGNQERAQILATQLMAEAHGLGLARLPDLSVGAAADAVEAAGKGEFKRASWALEAAERFDSGRPSTSFAAARIAWREHRFAAAIEKGLVGYARLFRQPLERQLALLGMAMAGLWTVEVGLCLLILALAVLRGPSLIEALWESWRDPLSPPMAGLTLALLALWPLLLPGRTLSLLLWWSILLWGFSHRRERALILAFWLLVGALPLILQPIRTQAELALSPPMRAIESLREHRLPGSLFTDLGALVAVLPESPAVQELIGDVDRTIGQWDRADHVYRQVIASEPENAAALIDLGALYFRKGDFGTAVQFFKRASAIGSKDATAYFDLSQAYSESYLFDESRSALDRARAINDRQVSQWLQRPSHDRVVTVDGGLDRVDEIAGELEALWSGSEAAKSQWLPWRRWAMLGMVVPLFLIAILFAFVFRRLGWLFEYEENMAVGTLALCRSLPVAAPLATGRVVLASVEALWVAGIGAALWVNRIALRIPWGVDPGSALQWSLVGLGGAGLVVLTVGRVRGLRTRGASERALA